MPDSAQSAVMHLWRCPTCGWTRSGEHGGRCRNAFAHEPAERVMVERVEAVSVDDVHRWLTDWANAHDAGPDFIEDETLAVFDFIAELRKWLDGDASDQKQNPEEDG